jgi:hypothetical protein
MGFLGYSKLNLDMELLNACPICEQTDFEIVSKSDKFNHKIVNVICKKCSFTFLNPAPTEAALEDFYKNRYWEFYFSPKPSVKMLTVTKSSERAAYHCNYIKNNIDFDSVFSFVDIGGGDGTLIKSLRNNSDENKEFILVEPNDKYRQFAVENDSCTLNYRSIHQVARSSNRRLISLVHSLEHISNPVKFLSDLSALLNEGDYLFIDVPDVFGYWHVSEVHIAHVNHFNTQTLSQAATISGFEVVDVSMHSPIRHPKSVRGIFRKSNNLLPSIPDDVFNNIEKTKKAFARVDETAKEWHSLKNMIKLKIKDIFNIAKY